MLKGLYILCIFTSQVAEIMNEHFINVKVDREERPDVDKGCKTFQPWIFHPKASTPEFSTPNFSTIQLEMILQRTFQPQIIFQHQHPTPDISISTLNSSTVNQFDLFEHLLELIL